MGTNDIEQIIHHNSSIAAEPTMRRKSMMLLHVTHMSSAVCAHRSIVLVQCPCRTPQLEITFARVKCPLLGESLTNISKLPVAQSNWLSNSGLIYFGLFVAFARFYKIFFLLTMSSFRTLYSSIGYRFVSFLALQSSFALNTSIFGSVLNTFAFEFVRVLCAIIYRNTACARKRRGTCATWKVSSARTS